MILKAGKLTDDVGDRHMNTTFCSLLVTCLLLTQAATTAKAPASFHWEWKNWQELLAAQSLRNAKVTNAEKAALASAIQDQLRPEMADLEISSESQLEEAALDTRIKMIDLNGDGTPEVVAQGMSGCGATGNCSFWVFRKTGDHYELILNGYGETFTIQKESTNGFKDIVVASHSSATDSGVTLFRYKDGSYHEAGCYEANFAPLDDGVRDDSKEPRMTPKGCG